MRVMAEQWLPKEKKGKEEASAQAKRNGRLQGNYSYTKERMIMKTKRTSGPWAGRQDRCCVWRIAAGYITDELHRSQLSGFS